MLNDRILGKSASTLTVFYEIEHPSEEEDTRAQQSPMETDTPILPLEDTTVNNPSNRSVVIAGAIAGSIVGVTAESAEEQRSDSGLITER